MFALDILSRTPVYEQLVHQLENFLLSGILKPGDQLPSVRSVALSHSINPRTILHAYGELEKQALIVAVPGRGYFVTPDAPALLHRAQEAKLDEIRETAAKMALAGVKLDDVLCAVREAYEHTKS